MTQWRNSEGIDLTSLTHSPFNSRPVKAPISFTVSGKIPDIADFPKTMVRSVISSDCLPGPVAEYTIRSSFILLLRGSKRTDWILFSTSAHRYVRVFACAQPQAY